MHLISLLTHMQILESMRGSFTCGIATMVQSAWC
jgi:hypothetical protein